MSSKTIDNFKKIGLSEYEAKIFTELYQRSPQSASSLVGNTGVSRGRIYDVLRKLERNLLVIEVPVAKHPSTSSLYQVADFPECLERLKRELITDLEKQFEEIKQELKTLQREEYEEGLTSEDFMVIKGRKANNYYIKKIINETKKHLVTNFTAPLLIEYKNAFLNLKKRKIRSTYLISDIDLQNEKIIDILKGNEVYVLQLTTLKNIPILSVFKDVRPSMIISDQLNSILSFYKQTSDSLLVTNPALIQYQMYILELFQQGGEKWEG